MPANRGTLRGFTLLEVMVVLVLTGLLTGLLLQALQQVFRLQTHFGSENFNSQRTAMQIAWFRQTVTAMVPDYQGGEDPFRGASRRFAGTTLAPLDGPEAASAAFVWRLRFDPQRNETLLQYGSQEDSPVVMAWGGDSGRFEYLDAKGQSHDAWPPFAGEWPQLPSAIRFEILAGPEPASLIAVPKGQILARARRKDLESEK